MWKSSCFKSYSPKYFRFYNVFTSTDQCSQFICSRLMFPFRHCLFGIFTLSFVCIFHEVFQHSTFPLCTMYKLGSYTRSCCTSAIEKYKKWLISLKIELYWIYSNWAVNYSNRTFIMQDKVVYLLFLLWSPQLSHHSYNSV